MTNKDLFLEVLYAALHLSGTQKGNGNSTAIAKPLLSSEKPIKQEEVVDWTYKLFCGYWLVLPLPHQLATVFYHDATIAQEAASLNTSPKQMIQVG